MLKVTLAGVELPKALLHNKRSLSATKGPIFCDVAPPSFSDKPMTDADRVALLACALVDKSLSEFWIELFYSAYSNYFRYFF